MGAWEGGCSDQLSKVAGVPSLVRHDAAGAGEDVTVGDVAGSAEVGRGT